MSLLFAAALLATQSAGGDGQDLKPATAAAIVAGGKACIGATVDPAGQDARLAGWINAADGQKVDARGRVVMRDNVMLIAKPGIDGGCVVQAKASPGFDNAAFVTALGTAAGTPIGTDPQNPVTNLPNGELMVVQIGDDAGATFVQLVVANPNGKHAKQSQGK